eukprot:SAG25_NODE_2216_length_1829_cov_1.345665_3_plen_73_part_00
MALSITKKQYAHLIREISDALMIFQVALWRKVSARDLSLVAARPLWPADYVPTEVEEREADDPTRLQVASLV